MVSMSRAEAEKEGAFVFDGFLSFYCKTRADSKGVVSEQSVAPQLPSKTGLALVPCSRSAALSFVVRQFSRLDRRGFSVVTSKPGKVGRLAPDMEADKPTFRRLPRHLTTARRSREILKEKCSKPVSSPSCTERWDFAFSESGPQRSVLRHACLGAWVVRRALPGCKACPPSPISVIDLAACEEFDAARFGHYEFAAVLRFIRPPRPDPTLRLQISELQEEGGCSVTIVTGDSVLTACHVAAETGLIDGAPPPAPEPAISVEPSPAPRRAAGAGGGRRRGGGDEADDDRASREKAGEGEEQGDGGGRVGAKGSGGGEGKSKSKKAKAKKGRKSGGKVKGKGKGKGKEAAAAAAKTEGDKPGGGREALAGKKPASKRAGSGDGGRAEAGGAPQKKKTALLLTATPTETGVRKRWDGLIVC